MTETRTLNPYEEAIKVYLKEPSTRPFQVDLELHLRNPNAYVKSTPDYFVMGRPVDSTALKKYIVDPSFDFFNCSWTEWHPDCWHCYLFAGPLNLIFTSIPYTLEYVSYERKNVLRIHSYDKIESRI